MHPHNIPCHEGIRGMEMKHSAVCTLTLELSAQVPLLRFLFQLYTLVLLII
jgi:hypothetical protein